MALVYWLQQPGGTLLDITDRCQKWVCDLKESAEEGATAVNSLTIDDPDGDLDMFGHRVFAVEETDAVDPDDRFVFVGFAGKATIKRGPYTTGAGRHWVVELSDPNTILARRVMVGGDNKRPDESDNARIAWLEATHEGQAITDTRYMTSDNPVSMDDTDYLLQDALSVFNDCSQQSGKNYFITYFGDVDVTAETPYGGFSLWYDSVDSAEYQSTAKLTNILSEVDIPGGVFYIGREEDTSFDVDPMRIYWKVIVPYKNGYVQATQPSTLDTYGRRDKAMPAENVKKAATATRRARRYVTDLATPEHRATVKTTIPRASVNLIRPGMAVPVRVSHWPTEYRSEYVTMRVLSRRVVEISDDPDASFELTLELSRGVPGPPATVTSGQLQGSAGPYPWPSGPVYFANTGDTPGPGWQQVPTTGLIEALLDGSPPDAIRPYYGWKMLGSGDVTVHAVLSFYGVLIEGTYTVTCTITKNGTPIATDSREMTGNLVGWSDTFDLTAVDEPVVADDEIEVTMSSAPGLAFFRTPAGAGNGEILEITGGSLS